MTNVDDEINLLLHKKEALEINLRLGEKGLTKDLKSWNAMRDQLSQLENELAADLANAGTTSSTIVLDTSSIVPNTSSVVLDSMATNDTASASNYWFISTFFYFDYSVAIVVVLWPLQTILFLDLLCFGLYGWIIIFYVLFINTCVQLFSINFRYPIRTIF